METILPPQNKLVQDSEGNDENRYSDSNSNKTKIKYTKEPNKKFQDNKNKEYEKTQKQINEIIGALNKHQIETEFTINREINKLSSKIDNIKEEMIHDMENLRKKNETKTQNTLEGHSSRLEQAEDRISELDDEMEIKGKKLKTY
jgi:hypothetical protein